jgi:hypothetical protein
VVAPGTSKTLPGSREKPSAVSSTVALVRSQSAPTRKRPTPPVAAAIPDSKQQKVTLLEAKHATTRARAAPAKSKPRTITVTGGGRKAVEVVRIPKASMKKKSADLSLSLNST